MANDLYLSYAPFGKFFKPGMARCHSMSCGVTAAEPRMACSPSTTPRASLMGAISRWFGYRILGDGSMQAHPPQPGCAPRCGHGGFGWHGSDTRRWRPAGYRRRTATGDQHLTTWPLVDDQQYIGSAETGCLAAIRRAGGHGSAPDGSGGTVSSLRGGLC